MLGRFSISKDCLLLFAPGGGRVKRPLKRKMLRALLEQVLIEGGVSAQTSWQNSGLVAGQAVCQCFDCRLIEPRRAAIRNYGYGGLLLQIEIPVVDQELYADHLIASIEGSCFPLSLPDAASFMKPEALVFEAIGPGSPDSALQDEATLRSTDLPWLNIGDRLNSQRHGLCKVIRVDVENKYAYFINIDGKKFRLNELEFADESLCFIEQTVETKREQALGLLS